MIKLSSILSEIKLFSSNIGLIIFEKNKDIIVDTIKNWKEEGNSLKYEDEDGNNIIDYIYEDLTNLSKKENWGNYLDNDVDDKINEAFENVLKVKVKEIYNNV